jgi:hypothetical protein
MQIMIANYDSSIINKFKASLTDDARVVIYQRHIFIVQASAFKMCFSLAYFAKNENSETAAPGSSRRLASSAWCR